MHRTRPLNEAELTGRADTHVETLVDGQRLQAPVIDAFNALRADARAAGFELAVASGYRSFARQCAIFNAKLAGARPTYDDEDRPVDVGALTAQQALAAVLRYSAMPGASRHHWGTDLDVYDASAIPADYDVQLTPGEVHPQGVFGPLHAWLDERMAAGASHGFYRPYAIDRGGVAPERWHLSYAPLSIACEAQLSESVLRRCWDAASELRLRSELESNLTALWRRYIAVAPGWCPAQPSPL
jgi:LAS superfamily LD-carboxypeptidase LdcB